MKNFPLDPIFGETPQIGQYVYVDLGDSIITGGELTGTLNRIDYEGVTVNGMSIPWRQIVQIEVLS